MAKSTTETGHYRNVANFKKLIDLAATFPRYAPVRPALQHDQLKSQYLATDNLMQSLNAAAALESRAKKKRYKAFAELPAYGTSIVAELENAAPESNMLEAARSLLKKMHGTRIGKEDGEEDEPADDTSGEKPAKKHSVSQRSFDALLSHFDKLIDVLEAEPEYATNHAELSISTLHLYLSELARLNADAIQAINVATAWRNQRQVALYGPVFGIVDTAKAVKKAILSPYKYKSPEYEQASAIAFRTIPDK